MRILPNIKGTKSLCTDKISMSGRSEYGLTTWRSLFVCKLAYKQALLPALAEMCLFFTVLHEMRAISLGYLLNPLCAAHFFITKIIILKTNLHSL